MNSPCLCPQCTDTPAPSYSGKWRAECEARYVSQLPKAERQDYYAQVLKSRGYEALAALKAEARMQYQLTMAGQA